MRKFIFWTRLSVLNQKCMTVERPSIALDQSEMVTSYEMRMLQTLSSLFCLSLKSTLGKITVSIIYCYILSIIDKSGIL